MKLLIVVIFLVFSTPAYSLMNETVCANLVVTELKVVNPNLSGQAENQAKQYWAAICKGIIAHITTSADINLGAGNIIVPGLGLFDSVALPVTGSAVNAAVILPGKIQ